MKRPEAGADTPGCLWVVATPIGNLEDITLRALRVLREVDRILAEDTRHAVKLLQHHDIRTALGSFHAHSTDKRLEQIVGDLVAGRRYALLSDAGTPVVSDPGQRLVAAAIEAGVQVTALPGASAVTTALSVSGLPCDRFTFYGFLPRAGKRRRTALDDIARSSTTAVLFEAPTRIASTLDDLIASVPGRRIAVCRELTKLHEEVTRGTAETLRAALPERVRGELTLVIEPGRAEAAPVEVSDSERTARVRELLANGLGAKQAADELSRWLGISRRDAYRFVQTVRSSDV